jgi:hypothetical protein
MKEDTILVVTCLLSILLLTLHVTDDIVRGISKAEPSDIALVVLVVALTEPHLTLPRRGPVLLVPPAGRRECSLCVRQTLCQGCRPFEHTFRSTDADSDACATEPAEESDSR